MRKHLNNMNEKELKSYFHFLGRKTRFKTQAFKEVQLLLRFNYGYSKKYLFKYEK